MTTDPLGAVVKHDAYRSRRTWIRTLGIGVLMYREQPAGEIATLANLEYD